jgi:hypothetical protein
MQVQSDTATQTSSVKTSRKFPVFFTSVHLQNIHTRTLRMPEKDMDKYH